MTYGMYNSVLSSSEVFAGVRQDDIDEMLSCLSAQVKRFAKGEYIISEGDAPETMGLVLAGHVYVVKEDFWGDRAILSTVGAGNVFAISFVCSGAAGVSVSVVAEEDTTVMFLNYRRMVSSCRNACPRHSRLIENLLRCVSLENLELTEKLEHLTRRTTREKLLSYLSARARLSGKQLFTIPFDRQELADYLSVDRSAMSTELSRLRREGVINFDKNYFTILGK